MKISILYAGFLSACLVAPAHAGLFDDDEARKAILDMRQRIEQVRQSTDAANAKLKESLAVSQAETQGLKQGLKEEIQRTQDDAAQLRRALLDLQSQIEQIRQDQARLRGQNESLARDLAEVQRRQKDLAAGVDERLSKVEPIKVSADGKEFLAEPNEKRDYEAAFAVFKRGEFSAAAPLLSDFLRRYPRSGYSPLAWFWLGTAQYANRDYKEGATSFRSMLSLAPEHAKAPEAMLSLANCQTELKESKVARKILEDLLKTYPQSEAAAAAKERLSKSKP